MDGKSEVRVFFLKVGVATYPQKAEGCPDLRS